MEASDFHRGLINQILAEHQAVDADDPSDTVTAHFVADEANNEYLMIHAGWKQDGKKRVYGVVFHAWLRENKIWIERDLVLPSVTRELIERGVPHEAIVAAFYEPADVTAAEPVTA